MNTSKGESQMESLFRYNWMVREEWYNWCEQCSEEELLAERTGGVGGILKTLLHIIDVEWSWIRMLQGKPDPQALFEEYGSLKRIRALDAEYHAEVAEFVASWTDDMEHHLYQVPMTDGGNVQHFTWGEIMRHILVHEVHHIGQLSVWAREIGTEPVSANFIGRGLISEQ